MGLFDNLKTITQGTPQQGAGNNTASGEMLKKILVVEDEKLLGDALETKLKHSGYEVSRAENGQVGLEKALAENPSLILLDLMMPVMDGTTMLKNLKQHPEFKICPVIVLTNAGDVEHMTQARLYFDAAEFLIKSNVSLEEIIEHVKQMIGPGAQTT